VLTNQGISPGRAMQAIEVQGRVANTSVVTDVEATMGGTFAGTWFEPATATLHVGATSATSRRTAERVIARGGLSADAVVTPVRSTMAELLAMQKQWDRKLASLFEREEVQTGLEPQRNAVTVTLSSSVPAARRLALEREASASAVNVFVTAAAGQLGFRPLAKTKCKTWVKNKGYCDASLTSGVTLLIGGTPKCTAGPLAINEKGERVALTAGHCLTAIGQKWSATNTAEVESVVGPVEAFQNGGEAGEGKGDFGSILIEPAWQTKNANIPVFAVTAEWKKMNAKKEETSYPIRGERKPEVGNTNCHVGQTSGESCAEIKIVNVVFVSGVKTYEGLVEDTGPELIGEGGDSGGPWLFVEANQEVLMEGTLAGWDYECKKVPLAPNLYKTEKECREVLKLPGEGEWEQVKYTCTEVPEVKEGANFFPTKAQCEELEEAGNGKWERKPQLHLVWEPLKQPVGGAAQGSLEALKLQLLTTANEVKNATSTSVLVLEAFPVSFTSLPAEPNAIKTELQNVAGTLKGEGLFLRGEFLKATGGLYEVLFLKVELPASKAECATEGDAKGEVLVPRGNFTVVHDISSGEGVGILFEVKEFMVTCGIVKVKIKGSALGLLTPVGKQILWLGLEASLHCDGKTTGEPKETKYWTSLLSSELTALLLANFGTGFKRSCEEIVPTTVSIDVGKMIELMQ
jgi:hypothetical protein